MKCNGKAGSKNKVRAGNSKEEVCFAMRAPRQARQGKLGSREGEGTGTAHVQRKTMR